MKIKLGRVDEVLDKFKFQTEERCYYKEFDGGERVCINRYNRMLWLYCKNRIAIKSMEFVFSLYDLGYLDA